MPGAAGPEWMGGSLPGLLGASPATWTWTRGSAARVLACTSFGSWRTAEGWTPSTSPPLAPEAEAGLGLASGAPRGFL